MKGNGNMKDLLTASERKAVAKRLKGADPPPDCAMLEITAPTKAQCTGLKKPYCLLDDKPCGFKKPLAEGG